MSRVGKKPIQIPDGVSVNIDKDRVSIKGSKGELHWKVPSRIKLIKDNNNLIVERSTDLKMDRSLHGLSRSLIHNMIVGVTEGFSRELQLIGIGYRAQMKGNKMELSLGYARPSEFTLPEGVTCEIDAKQTRITLRGIDKQLLGQVAADIRSLRPPDAYKGKGIRYVDEKVKLKPGKAAAK